MHPLAAIRGKIFIKCINTQTSSGLNCRPSTRSSALPPAISLIVSRH